MDVPYSHSQELAWRRDIILFLLLLVATLLVALEQGHRNASSLWVVVEFGFIDLWGKYISRLLFFFLIWGMMLGIVAAPIPLIFIQTKELKKLLPAILGGVAAGLISPFLLLVNFAMAIYIPLGIISFIFPNTIEVTNLGFAFLCAAYIVFIIIAFDMPLLLIGYIKKGRLYLKFLAVILFPYLAFEVFMTALSIIAGLLKYCSWKVHLPAFIIGYGLTLLTAIVLNLILARDAKPASKAVITLAVFILSIISANISVSLFHWGEYASAAWAALVSPIFFSYLFKFLRKDLETSLSAFAGILTGLGLGLSAADFIKLNITGHGAFGLFCGTALALGIGFSFAMIFAPRVGVFLARLLRLRSMNGSLLTLGLVLGLVAGFVIGGFLKRAGVV